jgi:AraC-like DNA-binding protein
VSEAARRFGFSDIYHFSKVFKKTKGYPPSTAKTLLS